MVTCKVYSKAKVTKGFALGEEVDGCFSFL